MAERRAPSDTKKHRDFLSESMGNKPVNGIPGIGERTRARMNSQNITQASQVYGQFLVLNRSPIAFESWLKDNFQASRRQAGDCVNAFDKYYEKYN